MTTTLKGGIKIVKYDLRTCDSAYFFLLEFMAMTSDEYIIETAINCDNDFELFWNNNIERIKAVDISDLRIMAFHVTGALDRCSEMRCNGLINLQMVLSGDTILVRELKKIGIIFDIENRTISYDGMSYDINYEHYCDKHCLAGVDKKLNLISHRICYDFCVNGFLLNDNVFDYGTRIHERPEFLMTLAQLFPQVEELEDFWMQKSTSYRIDFYATIDQVHRFNFELDEFRDPPYDGWCELDDEMKIKKWMLSHARDRATDGLSEQYLYIKNDVSIPANQIVEITKV